MPDKTLASLTAANPATGGLFYGTQGGADRKFTLTAAGAAMMEAADAIKLDELAAPTDVTTLNATTSAHGLLPKLGGGTTNFLRADGAWAAPPGESRSVICSGPAWTLTAEQCQNGFVYVAESLYLYLPPIAEGMSCTIIAIGPVLITVCPDSSDQIMADGTPLGYNYSMESLNQNGDRAVLSYYSAHNWYAATNGWGAGV